MNQSRINFPINLAVISFLGGFILLTYWDWRKSLVMFLVMHLSLACVRGIRSSEIVYERKILGIAFWLSFVGETVGWFWVAANHPLCALLAGGGAWALRFLATFHGGTEQGIEN